MTARCMQGNGDSVLSSQFSISSTEKLETCSFLVPIHARLRSSFTSLPSVFVLQCHAVSQPLSRCPRNSSRRVRLLKAICLLYVAADFIRFNFRLGQREHLRATPSNVHTHTCTHTLFCGWSIDQQKGMYHLLFGCLLAYRVMESDIRQTAQLPVLQVMT